MKSQQKKLERRIQINISQFAFLTQVKYKSKNNNKNAFLTT